MEHFDHRRLTVYQRAIDFVALADQIAAELPRGRSYRADQLRRAASSVALNVAEGAGEFSLPEKARFYRMARRSSTECAATLDVCARLGLAADDRVSEGHELVCQIISMLVVLIRRCEGEGKGKGMGMAKGKGKGKG